MTYRSGLHILIFNLLKFYFDLLIIIKNIILKKFNDNNNK